MSATIRIDFDVHAEAISKALQAELSKLQGVVSQANAQFDKIPKPKIVPDDAPQQINTLTELRRKAEEQIAQHRAAFSKEAWGTEKKAATAIVEEIKKLDAQKEANKLLLLDKTISESDKKKVQAEQRELTRSIALMRKIGLENERIREHGAGGVVGIMGQSRNFENYSKMFANIGKMAGVAALGAALFNKEISETIGVVTQTTSAAAAFVGGVGGVVKMLVSAEKAQKILNIAMMAAPWALAIGAVVTLIAYADDIVNFFSGGGDAAEKQSRQVQTAGMRLDEYNKKLQEVLDYNRKNAIQYAREAEEAEARGDKAEADRLRTLAKGSKMFAAENVETKKKAQKEEDALDIEIGNKEKQKAKEAKDFSQKIADEKILALKDGFQKEKAILEVKYKQDLHEAKGSAELTLLVQERYRRELRDLEVKHQAELREIRRKAVQQQLDDMARAENAVRELNNKAATTNATTLDKHLAQLRKERAANLVGEERAAMYLRHQEEIKAAEDNQELITEILKRHAREREELDAKSTESAANAAKKQVDAYKEIASSVIGLIGSLTSLSGVEHQRDEEADKALDKQLAKHEKMMDARAALAKDEKQALAIRKKGEAERQQMMDARNAEEAAAAEKENAQAARQNTLNLLQAASAMVVAIANYSASTAATAGPLALALIPAGITAIMAIYASAKSGLGFERGGFTGRGRNDEPAGLVHKNEFVLPAGSFAVNESGQLIGLKGGDVVESLRQFGFANSIGKKDSIDTVESLRQFGFANLMQRQNQVLEEIRDAVRRPQVMNNSKLVLSNKQAQRSLNRESI